MARISQNIPDDVVRYRKMLAAMRGVELQELDNAVWEEYMQHHPLTNEPGHPSNEGNTDE